MKFVASCVAGFFMIGSAAMASPVNGTGLVTPDVIYGSGNANGDFTGSTTNNVELAMRGKIPFNGTTNYDGVDTYTYDPSTYPPTTTWKAAFNFDFSINVDADGTTGDTLDMYTYVFEMDTDPTTGTSFTGFDPINTLNPATGGSFDHAIGNNSTGNGGGTTTTDPATYATLIGTNNVAQQSWNLGFFPMPGFDPQAEGEYTFNLFAFDANDTQVASTSMKIVYGAIPAVPLPASLPLLLTALGGIGLLARRRRNGAKV